MLCDVSSHVIFSPRSTRSRVVYRSAYLEMKAPLGHLGSLDHTTPGRFFLGRSPHGTDRSRFRPAEVQSGMQNLYSCTDEHGGTRASRGKGPVFNISLQPSCLDGTVFWPLSAVCRPLLNAFGPIRSAGCAGGAGAANALGGACRKCLAGGEIDYFLTSHHPCPLKDKSGGEVGICRGCVDGSSGAAAARLLLKKVDKKHDHHHQHPGRWLLIIRVRIGHLGWGTCAQRRDSHLCDTSAEKCAGECGALKKFFLCCHKCMKIAFFLPIFVSFFIFEAAHRRCQYITSSAYHAL